MAKKKVEEIRGNKLIEWIEENKAGEHVIIAVDENNRYMKVKDVWEGESNGGAIMLDVEEM